MALLRRWRFAPALRITAAAAMVLGVTVVAMLAEVRPAFAQAPSVATLDARERASGNRTSVAEQIGARLFITVWPAQVLKVAANSIDDDIVVGIRVSGVHFHAPLTRDTFAREIVDVASLALTTPHVSEVDVWAVVPLRVPRGAVVSGDLAIPTSRTVFTLTMRRGESRASALARMLAGDGVYWDQEWVHTLGKGGH